MRFRIVETKLDPADFGRVLEKSPLPPIFSTEAEARAAMGEIALKAMRHGYDSDVGTWWAHSASGEVLSYAVEAVGPNE